MGAAPPGDGRWVNVVLTVNGGEYALYMNGQLLRTLSGLPPLGESAPLTIGGMVCQGGHLRPFQRDG